MSTSTVVPQSIPQTSLYVGDLHPLVTESMLYSTFSNIGHVLSARVCRDVARQSSLCYGYVNFENPKDAERALESLIYENILGRQIRIMWCVRDPSLRKSGRGNIFIKNLDKSIAQKDLYDTFSHFGKILSCKIAIDENGISKGYGFIHFQDESCAEAAIKAINGKMINERIVYVGPFIPNTQRKSDTGKLKFNNCYVKNFADDLTDDGFKQIFEEYGVIKSACVMRDSEGKSKGFGFVCYIDPDHAELAVNNLNGKEIGGQFLYVCRAQRKAERQEVLRQQFERQRAERLSKYAAGINLYVKNLDDTIDDNRLKEAFSKFGKITSAKVMTDSTGTSKGFGFVCFTSAEEAKEAVALNGNLLGSKPLYVALAQRREDRRAKLFAEHQQRLQLQANVANLQAPHGLPNFFAQPTFNPTQRFFPIGANIASQPRWNRTGLGAPQIPMGHPGMGSATALRPAMNAAYMGGSGAVATLGQNPLAQGNMVNPQFRGQPVPRNIMSNAMSAVGPVANPAMVAAAVGPQQYNNQRTNMPPQMLGVPNNASRPSMAAVAGGIRPSANPQMPRQVMPSGVAGAPAASVRFNQTARNIATQQSRPVAPMRSNVGDQTQVGSSMHEKEQRQFCGEQIFLKVEKMDSGLAGKITGMLMGMETTDLLRAAENDDFLREKVQEAISVLQSRAATANLEAAGQTSDNGVSGQPETTDRS